MRHIICYDVPDDRRRTRLAKLLLDYGSRVQYSVFEALLTRELLERLEQEVAGLLDPEEDQLRIYAICGTCEGRVFLFGRGNLIRLEDAVFL